MADSGHPPAELHERLLICRTIKLNAGAHGGHRRCCHAQMQKNAQNKSQIARLILCVHTTLQVYCNLFLTFCKNRAQNASSAPEFLAPGRCLLWFIACGVGGKPPAFCRERTCPFRFQCGMVLAAGQHVVAVQLNNGFAVGGNGSLAGVSLASISKSLMVTVVSLRVTLFVLLLPVMVMPSGSSSVSW